MKKILKQTLKHLFSFPINAIARACLVAWILGVFSCLAADFDDQSLEYNDEPIKVFDHYPSVAQGHEEIYDKFLNGKLIYRSDPDSDEGKVELRITDLADPLDGTFDLSRCGDMSNYVSISTGYRKGRRPENGSKLEIWLAPRFLIEKELNSTASHFKPIMENWKQEAPVGMFWTWGGNWDSLEIDDYLTSENMDNLSKIDLYENYKKARGGQLWRIAVDNPRMRVMRALTWGVGGRGFHVSFVSAT